MKEQLTLFYITRGVISITFGYVGFLHGGIWGGILTTLVMLAGFIFYAQDGRHLIDPGKKLTPEQSASHEKEIRTRSVIIGAAVGILIYGGSMLLGKIQPAEGDMSMWALMAGTVVYFTTSTWKYRRTK